MTIVTFEKDPIAVKGGNLLIDGKPQPFMQEIVCSGIMIMEDKAKVIGRAPGSFNPMTGTVGNSVTIFLYVRLYHQDDTKPDKFGERISVDAYMKEYETQLIADDTTWVEDLTGIILGKMGDELVGANNQPPLYDANQVLVQEAGKFYNKTLITEGQFFNKLRSSPQVVNDIITKYLNDNKQRVEPPKR